MALVPLEVPRTVTTDPLTTSETLAATVFWILVVEEAVTLTVAPLREVTVSDDAPSIDFRVPATPRLLVVQEVVGVAAACVVAASALPAESYWLPLVAVAWPSRKPRRRRRTEGSGGAGALRAARHRDPRVAAETAAWGRVDLVQPYTGPCGNGTKPM